MAAETIDISNENYGSIDEEMPNQEVRFEFSLPMETPINRASVSGQYSSPSSPESEHWRGTISDLEVDATNHYFLFGLVIVYVAIGVLYYTFTTKWGLIDSIYFTVQTVTTVGYGDFVPFAPSHMVFTSVYILVGVGFIGSCLGVLVGTILDQEESIIFSRLMQQDEYVGGNLHMGLQGFLTGIPGHGLTYDARLSARGHDEEYDSNGHRKDQFSKLSHLKYYRATSFREDSRGRKRSKSFTENIAVTQFEKLRSHLLFSIINLIVVIGFGTISFSYLEKKPWYEALYFSVVSVTTVGYGDEVCTSNFSKCFAIVYLIVGCLFVAAALADLAAFPIERRRQKNELKVLRQYGNEMSKNDLIDITNIAHQLFVEGDDLSCTKEQFALVMLLKMNKIRPDDIRACMDQFEKIDHDHNGTLDAADVASSKIRRKSRHKMTRENSVTMMPVNIQD